MAEDDRFIRPAEAVVAGPLGKVGPGVEPVPCVQVRAADAAAQHLETHLPAPGRRLGPLDDLELSVLAADGLHEGAAGGSARQHNRTSPPPRKDRGVISRSSQVAVRLSPVGKVSR